MNKDQNWRMVGTKESITANADDSTLALRMGIAVNAIGAAQRFYWFVKDARQGLRASETGSGPFCSRLALFTRRCRL